MKLTQFYTDFQSIYSLLRGRYISIEEADTKIKALNDKAKNAGLDCNIALNLQQLQEIHDESFKAEEKQEEPVEESSSYS